MSADAGAEPPLLPVAGGEPPRLPIAKPPRRPRRWPWIGSVALALLAVVFLAVSDRKFPSDEERKYVGWWYGTEVLDETEVHAWVAEFRDDGALYLKFGRYYRVNTQKAWQFSSNEEVGRWRVRDGVQQLASEDVDDPSSWWTRAERWLATGESSRAHSYRTNRITEHELLYTSLSEGTDYRSLHASAPVELPDEPLLPENWPVPLSLEKK